MSARLIWPTNSALVPTTDIDGEIPLHWAEKILRIGRNTEDGDLGVRIAYVTNRYPAASHSFIRREIDAVEAQGIEVVRFSIRPPEMGRLPDPRDQAELTKTTAILGTGLVRIMICALIQLAASPKLSWRGIKVAFTKCSWRPTEFARRSAYFAEASLLSASIAKQQICHIHAHFGTNPAMVARIASILSDRPYSFTVHGPDEFDAPDSLDLKGKVHDSAFCVAVSSFGRSQLMRWSAFEDWQKIHVVRCGVDASFLDPATLTEPAAMPNLCSVARLSAQKGVPLLLEAAAELRRRERSFRLTLVGDGEMRSEIQSLITSKGLEGCVVLAGLADSSAVISHLQQSRALVLPSFAEGLPVVIMEALALARPVIVSAIAGTPELVRADCGWLVPAGSVDQLVEAMEAALEADTKQLASMGYVGRERVAKEYNAAENGKLLAVLFLTASQQ